MFHKLLFLGPGGRTVYQGSVEDAKEYFDGMGYPCPANINPADHYMDVIGGVVKKDEEKFDPTMLFGAWIDHASKKEITEMDKNLDDEGSNGGFEVKTIPGTKVKGILFGARGYKVATLTPLKIYHTLREQLCLKRFYPYLVRSGKLLI